jgi:uncharacterized protein (TIGR01777 family)
MSKIVITGAHGFVGSALSKAIETEGSEVVSLTRRPARTPSELHWDPARGDSFHLPPCEAIIHLAGESIMGLWTAKKKKVILASRIQSTNQLVSAIAQMPEAPRTLVCASAMGYYGDQGDTAMDEHHPAGQGFLATVCQAWEHEAGKAAQYGVRVVSTRFGMILAPSGGALKPMSLASKFGLGAKLGHGQQWMSWVSLNDAVRAILHILKTPSLSGPVNVTSPHPVTQQQFADALAKAQGRPRLWHIPAAVVNLAAGNMGKELLLSSTRMLPHKLLQTQFTFENPRLDGYLASVF